MLLAEQTKKIITGKMLLKGQTENMMTAKTILACNNSVFCRG